MNPSIHGPASRRVLVLPLGDDALDADGRPGLQAALDFLDARGIPVERWGESTCDPEALGAVLLTAASDPRAHLHAGAEAREVVRRIAAAGGVLAADGHGVAALAGTETDEGESLVAGRRVTCASGAPALADELAAAGAEVDHGPDGEPWVISDRNLLTAQNDSSLQALAEALAQALIQMVPASRAD